MRNKILWFDETKIELFGLNASVTSGGNLGRSLRWSMVVASCCWDVFQQQGLGDLSGLRERWTEKSTERSLIEVLSALEQVFIKVSLYFAPLIFASILTSLLVTAAEKHPNSMMLPPPCFTGLTILRSSLHLATLPYRPDRWSVVEMVVLLEGSPISTEELWSSIRVTIGFLVTSLTKVLLPQLLSLAGRPALESFWFQTYSI